MTGSRALVMWLGLVLSACVPSAVPPPRVGSCSPDGVPTRLGGPDLYGKFGVVASDEYVGYMRSTTERVGARVMRISDQTIVAEWQPVYEIAELAERAIEAWRWDAPVIGRNAFVFSESWLLDQEDGSTTFWTRAERVPLDGATPSDVTHYEGPTLVSLALDERGRMAWADLAAQTIHVRDTDRTEQTIAAPAIRDTRIEFARDEIVYVSGAREVRALRLTDGATTALPIVPVEVVALFADANRVVVNDYVLDRARGTWEQIPLRVSSYGGGAWVCGRRTKDDTLAAYDLTTRRLVPIEDGLECNVTAARLVFTAGSRGEAFCLDLE